MKHIAWHFSGFQTHSNTYIFEMETVRGGRGLGGRRRGGSGQKNSTRAGF